MDRKIVIINNRLRNTICCQWFITDESLDKWKQSLLELAILVRHHNHYLWLLMQSYLAIPKNIIIQTKSMFMMHDENNATSNDKLVIVTDFLKFSKHAHQYMFIWNEHPRGFKLLHALNKNEHKGSYKRPSETRRST